MSNTTDKPTRISALNRLVQSGLIEENKEKHRESFKKETNEAKDQSANTRVDNSEILNREDQSTSGIESYIDTTKIRAWPYADRPETEIKDIEELAEDIKENGQSSPILLRELKKPEGQISYEYIFGCRRLAACRFLNQTVYAIVKSYEELPDNKAFAIMHGENEYRKSISSWAKYLSFKKIMDQGVYKSQRELSRSIGKNESYIKDVFTFDRIPNQLRTAIGPMTNVSIKTAKEIVSLAKQSDDLLALESLAEQIRDGITPSSLRRKVLNRVSNKPSKKTVAGQEGDLFSVTELSDGFKVSFKPSAANKITIDKFANLVLKELESQNESN